MSDSKHYPPEMSEFHEGFEYEMKSGFGDGTVKTQEQYDSAEWEKETYSLGEYPYVNRTMTGRNSDNLPLAIRVKYLDREDIESFGWKKEDDLPDPFTFKIKYDGINVAYLHYYGEYGETRVIIDCGDKKFSGILKNKNEFEKILQWTGILK